MEFLSKLNSPVMYLLCGGVILFVSVICLVFAVRAYRMGKALGIDVRKMKRRWQKLQRKRWGSAACPSPR